MSTPDETASQNTDMRVDPVRAKVLLENLQHVTQKVDAVRGSRKVRLIAVSKLKPATDILALHNDPSTPQTHFGENYVQELQTKASLLPSTINWHMIGALQTNKCKSLASTIPNLFCVSSVDTAKKASALNLGRGALEPPAAEPLRALVQVNTSGEASKSGVRPEEATELCRFVREECGHLRLAGLMTIGAIARSQAVEEGGNEDFDVLRETRERVVAELGMRREELELSMGMSSDFEAAIAQGSDEVRVGTTIFGERPPRSEATI